MALRLRAMRRVLKDTGSIYLHCDPTASHYLKLLMDAIYGQKNFRNEIIWKRRQDTHNLAKKHMGKIHDTILWYAHSRKSDYRIQYLPYEEEYLRKMYSKSDKKGRYRLLPCTNEAGGNRPYEFRGLTRAWRYTKQNMQSMYDQGLLYQATPTSPFQYKKYLADAKGVPIQDLWGDIPAARGIEHLGYPTQKPLALMERIIRASSNEGDTVLDPFC
ncbi:MAG: site-specific DNA-methyltransferase, partial [Chloroflexi bacterium]|nr:site-specific DNA-methyltransferase [Chloroflexota bacterium]